MRLHVQLTVVLLAVHARAATIASPDLEKKLPEIPEPSKDVDLPLENISSEQELIDSANTIKDVENNLRVKTVDIPVKVVIEEPKVDEETSSDVKRVEIDLNNPGEPQRQEHETQNPAHFAEEQQIVFAVKQTVLDTEASLKQGIQDVAEGIQNWINNNEQLSAIQQSIQSLQQSFANQFSKLNETIQSFWNQNSANAAPQIQPQQIETLENQLKALENNFDSGVKALSEGVQVFATLKQDKPTPPAPAPPNNLFVQYIQMFQNNLAAGFQNITQAFQNYVNQTTSGSSGGLLQGWNNGFQSIFNQQQATQSGAQSDEATTSRPTIWQGIQSSIQSILNPVPNQPNDAQGTQSTGTPNRPIAQAIQNLPFVQGVVNLIQPTRPEALPQPVKPSDVAPNAPEGTNTVPATPTKNDPQPPKANEEQPPVAESAPIKNIIQNNPIVKGISNAVQKLQSLSNPEKPRDTVVPPKDAEVDPKGHGNTGDTSGSSGVDVKNNVKVVTIEETIPQQLKSEVEEKPTAEIEKTDKS